jgi:polyisoprenyl-phosphate glycosyltransferase
MEPVFTVIVPVFNEKDCLDELYQRMSKVMEQTKESWELILVDDGSTDGSTDMIRALAKKDKHVRPVIFARNYGHQIAVTAGMDYSRGKAVVIIDADLQDPPEVIHELIAKWREGFEVVYAVRTEREGETWFKLKTASLFYRMIYKITDIKIPMDSGDFRLLDRKVVKAMNSMRERQRFLRGMSAWVGFRQVGVPYKRAARFAGKTKYSLKKMLKLAMTAITSFSYFPLQLATWFGVSLSVISLLLLIVTIILRALELKFLTGQAVTLIAVIFLGGIQLICMGILGEYIGRIYDEVKGRPLYTTSEAPDDENKK